MNKHSDREAAAYHAAGCVLVAQRVGFDVSGVEIRRGDGTHPVARVAPPAQARAEDRAVVELAGAEAERRYRGAVTLSAFRRGECDIGRALELLAGATSSDREADLCLAWLTQRALEALSDPQSWAQVEALAAALLEHESLSAEDVAEILER